MELRELNNQQPHMYRSQQGLIYFKHRELPVDVPDSFVGVAKQSPRYPPPNHLRSSIKLKQLEKSKQPAINQAFELNEDDIVSKPNQINHQDLCSIYNRLQPNLKGEFDGKLAKLLKIYNLIVQVHSKPVLNPNLHGNLEISDLLQSVVFLLHDEGMTNDAAELLAILCKHEMNSVCFAFDCIAKYVPDGTCTKSVLVDKSSNQALGVTNKNLDGNVLHGRIDFSGATHESSTLQEGDRIAQYVPDLDLSDGTCTKTVLVDKSSNQALGATIKNVDGSVIVGRIVYGGAAHESGSLQEGDEILEVNNVPMRGKNVDDVVDILDAMNGTLTLIVARNYNKPPKRILQEKIFVRTFFSYNGQNDDYIPCKELGLTFEKGQVLAIIDQSDPKWWQAHREGDSEWVLAGLIPSLNFLKQREKESMSHEDVASVYMKHEKKNLVSKLFNCPKGSSPRRRKKSPIIPFGPDEIPYYEELEMYYPIKYIKRPIILVGPKMIGQREIVAKLLQYSSRFASAISHTSKPRQEHERDGVDFHFITKAQFEADIKAGKFIECGLFENQYYGTSLEAMKEVVRSKKTCIHLVNTPSIFNFRQGRAGSELKPFFVFVRPDDSHPEKLRNIVSTFSQPKSNIEENIKSIIAEVQMIETHYLPYFDLVLTVTDIERAYQELLFAIEKIEKEPQWIPKFWRDLPTSM